MSNTYDPLICVYFNRRGCREGDKCKFKHIKNSKAGIPIRCSYENCRRDVKPGYNICPTCHKRLEKLEKRSKEESSASSSDDITPTSSPISSSSSSSSLSSLSLVGSVKSDIISLPSHNKFQAFDNDIDEDNNDNDKSNEEVLVNTPIIPESKSVVTTTEPDLISHEPSSNEASCDEASSNNSSEQKTTVLVESKDNKTEKQSINKIDKISATLSVLVAPSTSSTTSFTSSSTSSVKGFETKSNFGALSWADMEDEEDEENKEEIKEKAIEKVIEENKSESKIKENNIDNDNDFTPANSRRKKQRTNQRSRSKPIVSKLPHRITCCNNSNRKIYCIVEYCEDCFYKRERNGRYLPLKPCDAQGCSVLTPLSHCMRCILKH